MVDKSEFKDFSCKIVYVPKTLLETLPVINFFFSTDTTHRCAQNRQQLV